MAADGFWGHVTFLWRGSIGRVTQAPTHDPIYTCLWAAPTEFSGFIKKDTKLRNGRDALGGTEQSEWEMV